MWKLSTAARGLKQGATHPQNLATLHFSAQCSAEKQSWQNTFQCRQNKRVLGGGAGAPSHHKRGHSAPGNPYTHTPTPNEPGTLSTGSIQGNEIDLIAFKAGGENHRVLSGPPWAGHHTAHSQHQVSPGPHPGLQRGSETNTTASVSPPPHTVVFAGSRVLHVFKSGKEWGSLGCLEDSPNTRHEALCVHTQHWASS